MRIATIKKLCCPFDKEDLELTPIMEDLDENIIEGFLTCNNCKRFFPIVKGIPIMNPDAYREFRFEQPLLEKWQAHLKGKKIQDFRVVNDRLEEAKKIGRI